MKGFATAAASAGAILLAGAGGGFAADLNNLPVKAVPISGPTVCSSIVDFFTTACQVSAYGVRFYGVVDVGGSYQQNGAARDGFTATGLTYTPQKMNVGAKFLPASNGLSGNGVGFQVLEPLGGGWKFVGQVEAQFDPYSLDLRSGSDGLRSVLGETLGNARGTADSPTQNTFYNSLGFAGVSHDTFGTLTFGRQNSLSRDHFLAYDALGGSAAFSEIGGNGTLTGGGSTETQKGTVSVKYRVNIANFRIGLFSQLGGYDEGNPAKSSYQGDVGGDFKIGSGLLSVDLSGGQAKDAVAETLAIASFGPVAATLPGGGGIGNPLAPIQGVQAAITDNTYFTVGANYTIDRWKFFGGYEWIQLANPSDGGATSLTDIAGNNFSGTSIANGANPFFINNFSIVASGLTGSDKVYNFGWVGAKYSFTDALSLYGAFYYIDQSQFGAASTTASCSTNTRSSGNCHGTQDAFSVVLDYQFSAKWDTYVGTYYNHLEGGLASGYQATDFWTATAGVRFRW